MGIHDKYKEMRRSLGAEEFNAVLNWYRIKQTKSGYGSGKMISCPSKDHTDTHPSCHISKDGKGCFCFVCNRYFSPVDIVMEQEGMNFKDAFSYFWTEILERELPSTDKNPRDKFILSWDELNFIGLRGANVNMVREAVNYACPGISDIPPDVKLGKKDENGCCVVYRDKPVETLKDLYKEDPLTVIDMMSGKAVETVDFYNEQLEKLCAYMNSFWDTDLGGTKLLPDLDINPAEELWQTCCNKRKELSENLARAKKLRNILQGKRNKLMKAS